MKVKGVIKKIANALLSDDIEERTISQMLPGESGWALPWGMYADTDRKLWLNGKYGIHDEPGGTVEMRVKRVNGGFEVDISCCRDSTWSPGGDSYVGGARPEPVVKVVR